MRSGAASLGCGDQGEQVEFPALIEDGLRRLNHELDTKCAGIKLQCKFEPLAEIGERGNFFRQGDFRQGDAEVRGKLSV